MFEQFYRFSAAVVLTGSIVMGACSTMPNGRGWGQDATLTPGWERLGTAALNAARSPATWVPAVGALALQIDNADHKVSDWAIENTPVYGSRLKAQRMSDVLLEATGELWVASGLAAPSGGAEDWAMNKIEGFGVQLGAGIVTREVVGYLKEATDRTRPNGENRVSFPSAHASGSALFATLTSKNLDAFGLPEPVLIASRITLGAAAAATAWGRVESAQHYPSDVLAGIAIGHFFGAFLTDAFLGLDNPRNAMVLFEPIEKGAVASVRFRF